MISFSPLSTSSPIRSTIQFRFPGCRPSGLSLQWAINGSNDRRTGLRVFNGRARFVRSKEVRPVPSGCDAELVSVAASRSSKAEIDRLRQRRLARYRLPTDGRSGDPSVTSKNEAARSSEGHHQQYVTGAGPPVIPNNIAERTRYNFSGIAQFLRDNPR